MTCHAILSTQTGAGACTWTAAGEFLSSTPHQVKTAQSITQLNEQKLDRAVEFLQQMSFVLIQWQIPRFEKIRLSLEHGVLVTQSRKLQEISKRPCPLFLCSNTKNRRKNCLFHNLNRVNCFTPKHLEDVSWRRFMNSKQFALQVVVSLLTPPFVCRLRRLSDRFLLELDRRKSDRFCRWKSAAQCQQLLMLRMLSEKDRRDEVSRWRQISCVCKKRKLMEAGGKGGSRRPGWKNPWNDMRLKFRLPVCTLRLRQVTKSQQFNWICRMYRMCCAVLVLLWTSVWNYLQVMGHSGIA